MPEKLSEQDRKLLDALQANCRLSNQELADGQQGDPSNDRQT